MESTEKRKAAVWSKIQIEHMRLCQSLCAHCSDSNSLGVLQTSTLLQPMLRSVLSLHGKATGLFNGCQQLVVQLVIALVGWNVDPIKAGMGFG